MKIGVWLLWLAPLTFVGAVSGQSEEKPAPAAAVTTDTVVPTTPPFSRYEKMLSQSLFSPVTVEAPPETTPESPLSSKYFVVGVFSIGETKSAVIESRDSGEQSMLTVGGEPKNGLSLVKVNWSPIVSKSDVIIQEGEENGTIKFDQAETVEPLVPEPMDSASVLNPRASIGGGRNAAAANNNNNNPQNLRRRGPMGQGQGNGNNNHNNQPPRTFQPSQSPNPSVPVRRRIINAPPSP